MTAESNALAFQPDGALQEAHTVPAFERVLQRAAAERAFWDDIEASPQLRVAMDEALAHGERRGHLMVRFDPWVGNTTRAECFHHDCDADVVITLGAAGLHMAGRAIDIDCCHVDEDVIGAADAG